MGPVNPMLSASDLEEWVWLQESLGWWKGKPAVGTWTCPDLWNERFGLGQTRFWKKVTDPVNSRRREPGDMAAGGEFLTSAQVASCALTADLTFASSVVGPPWGSRSSGEGRRSSTNAILPLITSSLSRPSVWGYRKVITRHLMENPRASLSTWRVLGKWALRQWQNSFSKLHNLAKIIPVKIRN